MLKELMFSSIENFCRVALAMVFIWGVIMLFAFIKTFLSFRKDSAPTTTMPPWGPITTGPAHSIDEDLEGTIHVTKIIGFFVGLLELVIVLMLLVF